MMAEFVDMITDEGDLISASEIEDDSSSFARDAVCTEAMVLGKYELSNMPQQPQALVSDDHTQNSNYNMTKYRGKRDRISSSPRSIGSQVCTTIIFMIARYICSKEPV